jgi:hypothetical protein
MESLNDNLDPERLVEAAEACLKAAGEISEYTGKAAPFPADMMGSTLQPDCLASFTKWEVEQACAFLVRLGVLEKPRAKRAA